MGNDPALLLFQYIQSNPYLLWLMIGYGVIAIVNLILIMILFKRVMKVERTIE